MPTAPNTPAVFNAIAAICTALQVGGQPAFAAGSVHIGVFTNITDVVPCIEIAGENDDTQRYTLGSGLAQGGKIDDSQQYTLEMTIGLADTAGTELLLAQYRDSLTAAFHTSALLGLPGQVAFSGIVPGSGKRGYKLRNGQWWRVYDITIRARYEYAVIITP